MHKISFIAVCLTAILFACNATAGVRSIVDSGANTVRSQTRKNSSSTSVSICKNSGYSRTSCRQGEYGVETCPSNSHYFKYCCPADCVYTKQDCKNMGMLPDRSCHGYYSCKEDPYADYKDEEDLDY